MFERILLFGFGAMASAMLEGWLASGLEPQRFTVYNPRPKPVPPGVAFTRELPEGPFDALILGVKPQKLDEVAAEVTPLAGPQTLLVSILAGVELAGLVRRFPSAGRIVRMMPNLAAAIGKSPVALLGQGLDSTEHDTMTELAVGLGSAEWLADESQFDLVTALAGSGPGFVYRFIDALAEGAAGLGLEPEQAERMAVQMVEGAAALAAASEAAPAELARRVASPGGMTQRGLDILDGDRALDALVARCLAATRNRGRELAAATRD